MAECHVVGSTKVVSTSEDREGTTFYTIVAGALSGEKWTVTARYTTFEMLSRSFSNLPVPFPGKKPLRSVFGFKDDIKEERRAELDSWLAAVVVASSVKPFSRSRLHDFLSCPRELRKPFFVPQNTFNVRMSAGVTPGQMLQVEMGGRIYKIRCPENVSAGVVFSAEFPPPEPQVATPIEDGVVTRGVVVMASVVDDALQHLPSPSAPAAELVFAEPLEAECTAAESPHLAALAMASPIAAAQLAAAASAMPLAAPSIAPK